MYKAKFTKLHEMVLATYENEKILLVKAKELHSGLTAERTRLEEKSQLSTSNNNMVQCTIRVFLSWFYFIRSFFRI